MMVTPAKKKKRKEKAISISKVSVTVSSSAQGDVCEELSDPRIVPWLSGMREHTESRVALT